MWMLIALAALPLVEIALFVRLGGAIGLGATLLWTVASAAIGVSVARDAGARTARAVNRALADLRDPAQPAADGAIRLVAGVLLIVPGFLTDAAGLVLLVPAVRGLMLRRLGQRRAGAPGPVVIEGEFRDVTPRGPRPPQR